MKPHVSQDLRDQYSAGVNPDYGVQTPTLVNAPKCGGLDLEIAVLKTYPFDSAVQRMTVITMKKGSQQFEVFVKGAPEKVASLCRPETGIEW
jgi:magnesium-transporting ATPase (P-type)